MDSIAAKQPDSPAATTRDLGFSFTGNAREYFGIWIVNLLLSIITIGIYTAWAKVRRLRYFYGNTWLDGHNFEYHAQPKQILIGRLIVFGFLALINVLVNFVSPLFALIFIPYLLALPWLINKSMAFNARMTSYRNVRLNFRGSYWGALLTFVLMPMVASISLGLLAPIASRMSSNYIGKHLGYGAARFGTDVKLGTLYRNLGATFLFGVSVTLVVAGVAAAIGYGFFELSGKAALSIDPGRELVSILVVAGVVGLYLALFLAAFFYLAGVRNAAFNATRLDGQHEFKSTLGRGRYVWILVSNLVASIVTIGMLRPWAAIRTWRYLAGSTTLVAAGALDHFVDEAAPKGNVASAEFFDIEGIDFGL
ncbi:MAG: DUF898 domain-containing protein [Nitratireductor sp.]|nr:DUF898 domain-containing protein [Nitratireductor sp.]